MKKIIYIALLSLISFRYHSQNGGFKIKFQRYDDFAMHVHAGMAINISVGSFVYYKTKNTAKALLFGYSAAVLAGGVKEVVHDNLLHRGTPSLKDFLGTTWGATVSFPIVLCGIKIHEQKIANREYFEHYGDSIRNVLQHD